MSKIYDALINCNPERAIEVGYLCENPNCHEPIEDSRPLVEDWRIPKGRTKRLCPKCDEEDRADQRTKDILEIVAPDLPGTRMGDWDMLFVKMFGKVGKL